MVKRGRKISYLCKTKEKDLIDESGWEVGTELWDLERKVGKIQSDCYSLREHHLLVKGLSRLGPDIKTLAHSVMFLQEEWSSNFYHHHQEHCTLQQQVFSPSSLSPSYITSPWRAEAVVYMHQGTGGRKYLLRENLYGVMLMGLWLCIAGSFTPDADRLVCLSYLSYRVKLANVVWPVWIKLA